MASERVKEILSAQDSDIEDLNVLFVRAGVSEMAAHILHSALKLFALQGYAATSVREIVQDAGATNPMLYYYFGSKEGVFTRLLELIFALFLEAIKAEIPAERSLCEKLRGIVALHLKVLRERPIAVQLVYSVVFGPPRGGPSFNVIDTHRGAFEHYERIFVEAMESKELDVQYGFSAKFLGEQLIGVINNHMMHVLNLLRCAKDEQAHTEISEYYLGEEAVDRLVSFFLAGAGKIKE